MSTFLTFVPGRRAHWLYGRSRCADRFAEDGRGTCVRWAGQSPARGTAPRGSRAARALESLTGQALDGSMAAARAEGWGLRRIADAAYLSHETVRGRLARADERGREP